MPRVLSGRNDPRVSMFYPRVVIAYAVICVVALAFIIVSAIVSAIVGG